MVSRCLIRKGDSLLDFGEKQLLLAIVVSCVDSKVIGGIIG